MRNPNYVKYLSARPKAQRQPRKTRHIHGPGVVTANEPIGGRIG